MKKNIRSFDRVIRFILGGVLIFAAIILYEQPVAQWLSLAGGVFFLGEAILGRCRLVSLLGVKDAGQTLRKDALYLIGLIGVQIILAYEWWSAGWEKVSSTEFVDGIVGTLGFFASQNPFPWYGKFLLGFATENATLFAYAIQWSQITIAITLVVAGLVYIYSRRKEALIVSIIALIGGILMNINFYFAAAWTNPGTHGINVVMLWTQSILVYVWLYTISQIKSSD